jgi:hypothetical protein
MEKIKGGCGVYAILLYSSAVLQQFNEHGSAMPVPSTTVFKIV